MGKRNSSDQEGWLSSPSWGEVRGKLAGGGSCYPGGRSRRSPAAAPGLAASHHQLGTNSQRRESAESLGGGRGEGPPSVSVKPSRGF